MDYLLLNVCQQLINLISVFITLFFKCFTAIFKKIKHALYKQKRPCKAGRNVYKGKERPAKARFWFYKRGIPVSWKNLSSYKQILFFSVELYR